MANYNDALVAIASKTYALTPEDTVTAAYLAYNLLHDDSFLKLEKITEWQEKMHKYFERLQTHYEMDDPEKLLNACDFMTITYFFANEQQKLAD